MSSTTAPSNLDPWKFPAAKTVVWNTPEVKSSGKSAQAAQPATYYGAYFYPFTKPGVDSVFAVVGGKETIIARVEPVNGFEIIRYFCDDDALDEGLCTGCWTKDPNTGDPLFAVGGQSGVIKILNVKTGEVVQTLSGHGDEIMEILLSPLNLTLIASASADSTVRIWSIDPKHKAQPCALICGGEGHRETILSIAFHSSGRYLLSGGMDHIVNLWVLPDLPDASTGTDKPLTLMYPHFSTTMVHSNYIDCLAFHGDYILSKAAREFKIVLWAIQGFTSRAPPPTPSQAPTTHEWRQTRSAFGGSFERLLQFSIPDTEPFFMRFGLFTRPDRHAMLSMGSVGGKIYMWDLTRLEVFGKGTGTQGGIRDATPSERGSPVVPGVVGGGLGRPVKFREDDLSDMFALVRPHTVMEVARVKSPIRYIGWSNGGETMVFVGEGGLIAVCTRWEK
ncbi:hypothetical protein RUND412_000916 [Rhizina undulata]